MKWPSKTLVLALSVFVSCIGFVVFTGRYKFPSSDDLIYIYVNVSQVVFETDRNFLSVALDTSFLRCRFYTLNESDWARLEELSELLSPGYIRLGGTAADEVFFMVNGDVNYLSTINKTCTNDTLSDDSLILTGKSWIKINEFANKSKLNLIFDLNALLRTDDGWDSSNAQNLLDFSAKNEFPLDFQLGNEPNSFKHVFNVTITGKQLATDFNKLKTLLNSFEVYRYSKLIGPDVTRPKHLETSSIEYLREFLSSTKSVDVVSWHQYYLNGRTAQLDDFLNPETFNLLQPQIKAISKIVEEHSNNLPIWISETSSAYGSGAPGLSDRFAASFLWLDKLGVAARHGISVVIRQTLLEGYYALIDSELSPNPDFWISFFYKNLVGNRVFDTTSSNLKWIENKYLRFYSHCTASRLMENGQVVVFGMNFSNRTEKVIVSGFSTDYPIYSFTFTPENNNLTSKFLYLNGKKLVYARNSIYELLKNPEKVKFPLLLPNYSIAFWIFRDSTQRLCEKH